MADIFRRQLDARSNIMGVHCPCCNPYDHRNRKKLGRSIRRTLKLKDAKVLYEKEI